MSVSGSVRILAANNGNLFVVRAQASEEKYLFDAATTLGARYRELTIVGMAISP